MADHNFEDGKRTLVLSKGEYALYRDRTTGQVQLLVGPKAFSPSSSDEPVRFDKYENYVTCPMDDCIQKSVLAPTGFYATLYNPAKDDSHPRDGRSGTVEVELDVGKKVNLHGPCHFALWPGQMAEVIRGHHLRSNQYLVIKINDEVAARENWTQTIVKTTETEDGERETPRFTQAPKDLAVGKRYIIKGTEVSFYIPPTGVSVERNPKADSNAKDKHVYSALTVEQLQYCILGDEAGHKRYEKGPAVVFPTPTEQFVEINGEFRHPAIQLNPLQGIHLKVIAPYEENGVKYEEGQELFITGKDTPIYYPRQEHAIQKYDGKHKHFATTIPVGQGRYVLERLTGKIETLQGPEMALLDPRTNVFVRRPLTDEQVKLWYPGNVARGEGALEYNAALRNMARSTPTTRSGAVSEGEYQRSVTRGRKRSKGEKTGGPIYAGGGGGGTLTAANMAMMDDSHEVVSYAASVDAVSAGPQFSNEAAMLVARHGDQSVHMADEIEVSSSYVAPRTLTIGNKYDGVPLIKPDPGYAVMVTDDSGNRRVVKGPSTILMAWDETLQVLQASTGTPKNHNRCLGIVYLQVKNNQVTDIFNVVTKDHVVVGMKLSFHLDFEGDENKWFEVENYVKLLCDHVRSVLLGAAKKRTASDMYLNGVEIVRDTILGAQEVDGDGNKSRKGMNFAENGMHVREVDVQDITITDTKISQMLHQAQFETVKSNIDLERSRRHLEDVREQEKINQDLATVQHATQEHQRHIQLATIQEELGITLASIAAQVKEFEQKLVASQAHNEKKQFEFESDQARAKAAAEQAHEINVAVQELTMKMVETETLAAVERFKAVAPELAGALTTLSNNATMEKLAEATGLINQLGGKNVADVIGNIFAGIGLEKVASKIGVPPRKKPNNGSKEVRPL